MRHIFGFALLAAAWGTVGWQLYGYEHRFPEHDAIGELIREIGEEERLARIAQRAEAIFDQGREIRP